MRDVLVIFDSKEFGLAPTRYKDFFITLVQIVGIGKIIKKFTELFL